MFHSHRVDLRGDGATCSSRDVGTAPDPLRDHARGRGLRLISRGSFVRNCTASRCYTPQAQARYGRKWSERRPCGVAVGEPVREERDGDASRAVLFSSSSPCRERSVAVRMSHSLPEPWLHGRSQHSRDFYAACCGGAVQAAVRMRVPAFEGKGFQACSSKAERCYHMAEVGGSIPSAPTSSARRGAWRARRALIVRPWGPWGRFLRPAGRTLCSERAT